MFSKGFAVVMMVIANFFLLSISGLSVGLTFGSSSQANLTRVIIMVIYLLLTALMVKVTRYLVKDATYKIAFTLLLESYAILAVGYLLLIAQYGVVQFFRKV